MVKVLKKQSILSNKKSLLNIAVYLIFLAFSFGILFICTASSPRYATNPWNDANAFLTMGRAMANGLTIYKDIFEQKGPLLYLLHAVASSISNSSFFGVYIIQSLFLSATAFAAYKIALLYVGTAWSVISAVLTCFVTVNSGGYYYGDSAEEFCLPLLMISIYFFCKYFKNAERNELGKPVFLLVGFFAGCVAMIKFTVIGFWFAWAAYISLYTWIAKKNLKKAFVNAMIFLGGMVLAVVPWIVYFAAKGALHDFINTYFVLNATAYPKAEGLGIISRILEPLRSLGENLVISPVLFILGFLGIFLFAVTKIFTEKKFFSRISVPFVCCLGLYIIYFGIRYYNYYFVPMSAFTVFSFIAVSRLLSKITKSKSQLISVILCVVIIPTTVIASNYCNLSSKFALRKGEETVQAKAAEYINLHNPDGKVLNYGSLDSGIYLAVKQVPQFKHFEQQNLLYDKYPENIDEQNKYISDSLADYVVIAAKPGIGLSDIYEKNMALKDKYLLVFSQKYSIAESALNNKKTNQTYYLFELKED